MTAAAALAVALFAAPGAAADPVRDALELVYHGQTDAALLRLGALAAEAPRDPRPAYVHALALAWKAEQHAEPTPIDQQVVAAAEHVIALSQARLSRDRRDARAFLFRGAGHGLLARNHLYRARRADAARESVRMRADLLRARQLHPRDPEAAFGLGLYDYYTAVLPRAARLLRFLAGMPGGDRERGLQAIEAAREHARLHGVEAQAQLYEIFAFHEDRPDRALHEIRDLARRYPGAPLWPLKMTEHLRARLGAAGEAAEVARDMLSAGRRHDSFRSPHVEALARLALGEALLLDLRLPEARQALLPVKDGPPGLPALGAKARFLLGRALELEGDEEGAAVHYRRAASLEGGDWSAQAAEALEEPLPAARVRAWRHVAEARRHAEAGRRDAAAASYAGARETWPECPEAALALAESALDQGHVEAARRALPRLRDDDTAATPWLRTWRWLIEAQIEDADGQRDDAVALYRRALHHSDGHPRLRSRAEDGLRRPFRAVALSPPPHAKAGPRASEMR